MKKQATSSVLMIRPVQFRMNEETAVNNYYQKKIEGLSAENVNQKAQEEFDGFVQKLEEAGIEVVVISDRIEANTPDSIFPNNWISFHDNKEVVLYPMFAENRRKERRKDVLDLLEEKGFLIDEITDYTSAEEDELFLEGTGSMIIDRPNAKVYAALSPRADEQLLIEFCEDHEMMPIIFTANQTVKDKRLPIYHTNVMMSIATTFAVVCADSIDDTKERKAVLNSLKEDGKEVILISEEQVNQFAGNMLQLQNASGDYYMVMSSQAYESLTAEQISKIEKHSKILHAPLYTIEACGGGSARCMLAEIFLPKKA